VERRAAGRSIQDDSVKGLIEAREAARAMKNWAEADRLRDALVAKGIVIKDNKDGTTSWEHRR
jgi:cysteinyl-tRNA synthetase